MIDKQKHLEVLSIMLPKIMAFCRNKAYMRAACYNEYICVETYWGDIRSDSDMFVYAKYTDMNDFDIHVEIAKRLKKLDTSRDTRCPKCGTKLDVNIS